MTGNFIFDQPMLQVPLDLSAVRLRVANRIRRPIFVQWDSPTQLRFSTDDLGSGPGSPITDSNGAGANILTDLLEPTTEWVDFVVDVFP